ncbi:MAG: CDP-diacylglycerol--glycerol-3-phosphate 3-phosphatidyltransferase [Planctomycetaceae bacterium]
MSVDSNSNEAVSPEIAPSGGGNPVNLPNAITSARLILAVVLFALIDLDGWWRLSAVLFMVAAATDVLDGYLARKYGQVTVLGRILDPFVDKIIICGAFIFLQGKVSGTLTSGVTGWMTFIIVAREMFITSLRAFLEQHGRDFSAKLTGKLKMGLQCVTVPFALLSLSQEFLSMLPDAISPELFVQVRDILLWGTVGITLYSGVEYSWRAIQVWKSPESPRF